MALRSLRAERPATPPPAPPAPDPNARGKAARNAELCAVELRALTAEKEAMHLAQRFAELKRENETIQGYRTTEDATHRKTRSELSDCKADLALSAVRYVTRTIIVAVIVALVLWLGLAIRGCAHAAPQAANVALVKATTMADATADRLLVPGIHVVFDGGKRTTVWTFAGLMTDSLYDYVRRGDIALVTHN